MISFMISVVPDWHYPTYTEVGPWDAISDCYALNVDDASAWACRAVAVRLLECITIG